MIKMCKCVVFGGSGTPFENFPSSSFLFERAWLPYSFLFSSFFLNYRAFALFSVAHASLYNVMIARGGINICLLQSKGYGMVVEYF